jgi:hypothetical protein
MKTWFWKASTTGKKPAPEVLPESERKFFRTYFPALQEAINPHLAEIAPLDRVAIERIMQAINEVVDGSNDPDTLNTAWTSRRTLQDIYRNDDPSYAFVGEARDVLNQMFEDIAHIRSCPASARGCGGPSPANPA